jgi:hypothetical protein
MTARLNKESAKVILKHVQMVQLIRLLNRSSNHTTSHMLALQFAHTQNTIVSCLDYAKVTNGAAGFQTHIRLSRMKEPSPRIFQRCFLISSDKKHTCFDDDELSSYSWRPNVATKSPILKHPRAHLPSSFRFTNQPFSHPQTNCV